RAVADRGAGVPRDVQVAEGHEVGALDADAVADRVLDVHVLDREVIAGDVHALRARGLPLEVEGRAGDAGERDVRDGERHFAGQLVRAGVEADLVAGVRV